MTETPFRPLSNEDLDWIRQRLSKGMGLPHDEAARLLADRDAWVERAFDVARLVPKEQS